MKGNFANGMKKEMERTRITGTILGEGGWGKEMERERQTNR